MPRARVPGKFNIHNYTSGQTGCQLPFLGTLILKAAGTMFIALPGARQGGALAVPAACLPHGQVRYILVRVDPPSSDTTSSRLTTSWSSSSPTFFNLLEYGRSSIPNLGFGKQFQKGQSEQADTGRGVNLKRGTGDIRSHPGACALMVLGGRSVLLSETLRAKAFEAKGPLLTTP